MHKTTKEGNAFYAILTLPSGHTYYLSRSAARRAWERTTLSASSQ